MPLGWMIPPSNPGPIIHLCRGWGALEALPLIFPKVGIYNLPTKRKPPVTLRIVARFNNLIYLGQIRSPCRVCHFGEVQTTPQEQQQHIIFATVVATTSHGCLTAWPAQHHYYLVQNLGPK